jgi:hypothetical protein
LGVDVGSVDFDRSVALTTTYGDHFAGDFASQQVIVEKKASLAALADNCEGHAKTASSIYRNAPRSKLVLGTMADK